MECQARVSVVSPKHTHRIGWHRESARHVRQDPTVGPSEPKLPVGESGDLIALFVDRAVVPATEEREIRQLRGPALSPVVDVMGLPYTHAAAREATPVVTIEQGAPDCRRNRPGLGRHLHDATVSAMLHDHAACVARQAARRFRGNVGSFFKH
jgi:hypothetical protein